VIGTDRLRRHARGEVHVPFPAVNSHPHSTSVGHRKKISTLVGNLARRAQRDRDVAVPAFSFTVTSSIEIGRRILSRSCPTPVHRDRRVRRVRQVDRKSSSSSSSRSSVSVR